MATIPEHEAIDLTLASPQHRINLEILGQESDEQKEQQAKEKLEVIKEGGEQCSTTSSSTTCVTIKDQQESGKCKQAPKRVVEGYVGCKSDKKVEPGFKARLDRNSSEDEVDEVSLHSLGRYELLQVARRTREDKRRWRRTIREREDNIQRETGRRPLKEDRDKSEEVYQNYKNAKAKLKLIDALLSKQSVEHYF